MIEILKLAKILFIWVNSIKSMEEYFMLILRPILFLALCLSLNLTLASERFEDSTTTSYTNGNLPLLLAERPGTRRRGIGCGTPPDLWSLDVLCETRSFCYADSKEVKLWLPGSGNLGQTNSLLLKIKNKATQQEVELPWPADKSSVAWPAEMPIESEVTYMIKLIQKYGSSYQSKVLYQIPVDYQNSTKNEAIEWLRETGCDEQADMLEKLQKQDA